MKELLHILAWFGIGALVALGVLAIASALKVQHLTAAEAARLAKLTLRQVRRFIILVLGVTVILAGVIMIVAPGPAIVVIPLGLAVLASEFVWARRLLKQYKSYALGLKKMAEENEVSRPRPFLAIFVILATIVGIAAAMYHPDWPPKHVLAFAGPLVGLEFGWCFLMIQRYRRRNQPAAAADPEPGHNPTSHAPRADQPNPTH